MVPQASNGYRSCLQQLLNFPVDCSHKSTCFFLLLACLIHVILHNAINEVIPSTPTVSDYTNNYRPQISEPPAQRLVVIICDGLRSQTLFSNKMAATPHLKEVVLNRGTWGVSHTAIPTESRSGHAALLAGIVEDMTSVTNSWMEQVLDVDHIFKRSNKTFAWGSDCLWNQFTAAGRLQSVSHNIDRENFVGKDAEELLDEMLKHVTSMLDETKPSDRDRMQRQKGLIFFLHFISIDLGGHALKPYTKAYMRLLGQMDSTVRKLEEVFEQFFNHDKRTAFLLTADHGMTDWGGHGGGHITETSTPVITWGSGLSGPKRGSVAGENMSQVDLCPFMASLLGIEIPSNNHGRLPTNLLNVSASTAAALMRANALQLIELFKVHWDLRGRISPSMFFSGFPDLTPASAKQRLHEASRHRDFIAMPLLKQLAADAQAGLKYFHQYDRFFLFMCTCATFVLWMLCLILSMLPVLNTESISPNLTEIGFSLAFFAVQCILLLFQQRPPLQWLLRLVPLFLFWCVWRHRRRLLSLPRSRSTVFHLLFIVMGLEMLVFCFRFRPLISVAVVVNAMWQLSAARRPCTSVSIVFLVSCVVLAIFPLCNVIDGTTNFALVPIGPIATAAILVTLLANRNLRKRLSRCQFVAFAAQMTLLLFVPITHYKAHAAIRTSEKLPVTVQVTNWFILLFTSLLNLLVCSFSSTAISVLSTVMSITIVYSLLCLSYESVFLVVLLVTVQSWAAMETSSEMDASSTFASIFLLNPNTGIEENTENTNFDGNRLWRICFAYMVLIFASLLGPGNVASVNSYDPNSIFTFFTICRFIIIIPLVFLKLFLPMVLSSCLFTVISSGYPLSDVVKVTMILSDYIALRFFVLIRNEGTWNEIGASVSHYLIGIVLCLLLISFLVSTRLLFQRSFRVSSQ